MNAKRRHRRRRRQQRQDEIVRFDGWAGGLSSYNTRSHFAGIPSRLLKRSPFPDLVWREATSDGEPVIGHLSQVCFFVRSAEPAIPKKQKRADPQKSTRSHDTQRRTECQKKN